jgi:hypothetical protein
VTSLSTEALLYGVDCVDFVDLAAGNKGFLSLPIRKLLVVFLQLLLPLPSFARLRSDVLLQNLSLMSMSILKELWLLLSIVIV